MIPYLIVTAVVALFILFKFVVQRVTIYEFEKGLKYTRGYFKGTLGAGTYWLLAPLSSIRKIDIRSTFVSITGQEVLSADGVTLKVSLPVQEKKKTIYTVEMVDFSDPVGDYRYARCGPRPNKIQIPMNRRSFPASLANTELENTSNSSQSLLTIGVTS